MNLVSGNGSYHFLHMIMGWTGVYSAFARETFFLRLMNLYLLHREPFVLFSYYVGMMLFWIEFQPIAVSIFYHRN